MATLNLTISSLDEVDENLQSLYVPDGDGFKLDVDVPVSASSEADKKKVGEFRSRNIAQAKLLEEQKAVVERYRALGEVEEIEKQIKEGEENRVQNAENSGVKNEEIETAVERRTKILEQRYESQIKATARQAAELTAERDKYRGFHLTGKVDQGIIAAANLYAPVADQALPDLLARGRAVFTYDESLGDLVAYDSNGEIIYGANPSSPLSTEEWIVNQRKEAKHLFQPDEGGGAAGSQNAAAKRGGRAVDGNASPEDLGARVDDIASGKAHVV